ncbi:MAG: hypothetical protein HUK26_02670, partial [Duodenibacillus sp.]|nr:hypothetical protein [Duodenibacillus sp.]
AEEAAEAVAARPALVMPEEEPLQQVQTDPSLVEPYAYEPVKYAGRPRPVLPPLDDEPLVQVHTSPAEADGQK